MSRAFGSGEYTLNDVYDDYENHYYLPHHSDNDTRKRILDSASGSETIKVRAKLTNIQDEMNLWRKEYVVEKLAQLALIPINHSYDALYDEEQRYFVLDFDQFGFFSEKFDIAIADGDKVIARVFEGSSNNELVIITDQPAIIKGSLNYKVITCLSDAPLKFESDVSSECNLTLFAAAIELECESPLSVNSLTLWSFNTCSIKSELLAKKSDIRVGYLEIIPDSLVECLEAPLYIFAEKVNCEGALLSKEGLVVTTMHWQDSHDAIIHSPTSLMISSRDFFSFGFHSASVYQVNTCNSDFSSTVYVGEYSYIHANATSFSEISTFKLNGQACSVSDTFMRNSGNVYYHPDIQVSWKVISDPSLEEVSCEEGLISFKTRSDIDTEKEYQEEQGLVDYSNVATSDRYLKDQKRHVFYSAEMDIYSNATIKIEGARLSITSQKSSIYHSGAIEQTLSTMERFKKTVDAIHRTGVFLQAADCIEFDAQQKLISVCPVIVKSGDEIKLQGLIQSESQVSISGRAIDIGDSAEIKSRDLAVITEDTTRLAKGSCIKVKNNLYVRCTDFIAESMSVRANTINIIADNKILLAGNLSAKIISLSGPLIIKRFSRIEADVLIEKALLKFGFGLAHVKSSQSSSMLNLGFNLNLNFSINKVHALSILRIAVNLTLSTLAFILPPAAPIILLAQGLFTFLTAAPAIAFSIKQLSHDFSLSNQSLPVMAQRLNTLSSAQQLLFSLVGVAVTALSGVNLISGVSHIGSHVRLPSNPLMDHLPTIPSLTDLLPVTPALQSLVTDYMTYTLMALSNTVERSFVNMTGDVNLGLGQSNFSLINLSMGGSLAAYQLDYSLFSADATWNINASRSSISYMMLNFGNTLPVIGGYSLRCYHVSTYSLGPSDTHLRWHVQAHDMVIGHQSHFEASSIHATNMTIQDHEQGQFVGTSIIVSNLTADGVLALVQSQLNVQHLLGHGNRQYYRSSINAKNLQIQSGSQEIVVGSYLHVDHDRVDGQRINLGSHDAIIHHDVQKGGEEISVQSSLDFKKASIQGGSEEINCETHIGILVVKDKASFVVDGGSAKIGELRNEENATTSFSMAEVEIEKQGENSGTIINKDGCFTGTVTNNEGSTYKESHVKVSGNISKAGQDERVARNEAARFKSVDLEDGVVTFHTGDSADLQFDREVCHDLLPLSYKANNEVLFKGEVISNTEFSLQSKGGITIDTHGQLIGSRTVNLISEEKIKNAGLVYGDQGVYANGKKGVTGVVSTHVETTHKKGFYHGHYRKQHSEQQVADGQAAFVSGHGACELESSQSAVDLEGTNIYGHTGIHLKAHDHVSIDGKVLENNVTEKDYAFGYDKYQVSNQQFVASQLEVGSQEAAIHIEVQGGQNHFYDNGTGYSCADGSKPTIIFDAKTHVRSQPILTDSYKHSGFNVSLDSIFGVKTDQKFDVGKSWQNRELLYGDIQQLKSSNGFVETVLNGMNLTVDALNFTTGLMDSGVDHSGAQFLLNRYMRPAAVFRFKYSNDKESHQHLGGFELDADTFVSKSKQLVLENGAKIHAQHGSVSGEVTLHDAELHDTQHHFESHIDVGIGLHGTVESVSGGISGSSQDQVHNVEASIDAENLGISAENIHHDQVLHQESTGYDYAVGGSTSGQFFVSGHMNGYGGSAFFGGTQQQGVFDHVGGISVDTPNHHFATGIWTTSQDQLLHMRDTFAISFDTPNTAHHQANFDNVNVPDNQDDAEGVVAPPSSLDNELVQQPQQNTIQLSPQQRLSFLELLNPFNKVDETEVVNPIDNTEAINPVDKVEAVNPVEVPADEEPSKEDMTKNINQLVPAEFNVVDQMLKQLHLTATYDPQYQLPLEKLDRTNPYVNAFLAGAYAGIDDFYQFLRHPIENLVDPLISVAVGAYHFSSALFLLDKTEVLEHLSLLFDKTLRLYEILHYLTQASGPELLKLVTEIGVGFILPEALFQAVRQVKLYQAFGKVGDVPVFSLRAHIEEIESGFTVNDYYKMSESFLVPPEFLNNFQGDNLLLSYAIDHEGKLLLANGYLYPLFDVGHPLFKTPVEYFDSRISAYEGLEKDYLHYESKRYHFYNMNQDGSLTEIHAYDDLLEFYKETKEQVLSGQGYVLITNLKSHNFVIVAPNVPRYIMSNYLVDLNRQVQKYNSVRVVDSDNIYMSHKSHHSALPVSESCVVAAGDIIFNDGSFVVNNKSGHYRPNGSHLPKLVERVFKRAGIAREMSFKLKGPTTVNDIFLDDPSFPPLVTKKPRPLSLTPFYYQRWILSAALLYAMFQQQDSAVNYKHVNQNEGAPVLDIMEVSYESLENEIEHLLLPYASVSKLPEHIHPLFKSIGYLEAGSEVINADDHVSETVHQVGNYLSFTAGSALTETFAVQCVGLEAMAALPLLGTLGVGAIVVLGGYFFYEEFNHFWYHPEDVIFDRIDTNAVSFSFLMNRLLSLQYGDLPPFATQYLPVYNCDYSRPPTLFAQIYTNPTEHDFSPHVVEKNLNSHP